MSAGAILGGASIGAGVGVSSVALAPFNAANTFMGSAFFGYGMILGERYMYQADWPKIQARLENGEKIENIIQEYTGTFTAVVMKEAKIIFETVTREFIAIMKAALEGSIPAGPVIRDDAPTIGDPRRPPPPHKVKEEIKKEAEIIKTPASIIKEGFEKTVTTSYSYTYDHLGKMTTNTFNSKQEMTQHIANMIKDIQSVSSQKDSNPLSLKWRAVRLNAAIKKFPELYNEAVRLL